MNEKRDDLLHNVDLFSGLESRYLRILSGSCSEVSFKKGDMLIEQGQRGLGLMIIVSGEVKVIKTLADGRELEVATLGSGEFIGEISVLDDAPRSASVVALEDTECLSLASWTFTAAMKNHPEIALQVLPVVAKRYRDTNNKLLELQGSQ